MCLLGHFLGFAKAVIKFEHLLYHEQNPVSITCSNSTVETPEHCMKSVQRYKKENRRMSMMSFLCL